MEELAEMVRLTTPLDRKDKEALEALAKRNGRKMATEARLAIKNHLESDDRPSDIRRAVA